MDNAVQQRENPSNVDIEDLEIDKSIYDLYDQYCHGFISRREFLKRAGGITIAGVSGLTMAQALFHVMQKRKQFRSLMNELKPRM